MTRSLWVFLPFGYLLTVLVETPVLLVGLSKHHPIARRVIAGFWLTACTYPIVTLVLPLVMVQQSRAVYLIVAEVFAPVAECLLFWFAFSKKARTRDFVVIVIANLASFGVGEILNAWNWFGLFSASP
jgi:hypothetical protein